jgi:transposase
MRFVKNLCWLQIRLLNRIHKESKRHHVRQRAHCILLSYQGYQVNELAKIFGRKERTIYTWLNQWEARHFAGLYDKKGRGRKPKLDDDQKRQVKEWAKEYPKNLRKIVALVREEYGITVSRRTIKRILRNLGFSWRRIRKNPKGKPDPEEYAQKEAELAELKRQAERGEIDLYYVDESGFCLIPYVPYAWQEKGETIAVESGGKKRLNILGFLSLERGLVAYTTQENIDGDVIIAFFDTFISELTRKTVVVMDNSTYHTSSAIEAKKAEWQSKNLELFYLPKSSPQLNLIEILWRFMKYEWVEWWAYKGWDYLVRYIEMVICGYGTEYEINFG